MMNTAPVVLLRRPLLQRGDAICSQCLHKLARPFYLSQQRRLSNTTPSKASAVSSKSIRSTFSKEYFWPNKILEEVLGQPRRGLQQKAVGGQEVIARDGVTTSLNLEDVRPQESLSNQSVQQDEYPHRRRKRLKEDAASAATAITPSYPIAPDASSRLTTASAALPSNSLKRRIATYLSLSKPRLTILVMLTTTSAYGIFPVPALLSVAATTTPSLSTLTLLFLTSGTILASASANTLNMLFEPAHDAKMSRTRNRPLVRKLVSPRGAFIFALVTGTLGTAALYYGVNPTVAFLGALNIALYAGVYTPFKRIHVVNTWVGALVGGIPPLMGWAAAAGQCATEDGGWQELLFGENSAGGWLLAGLLYCWQFPHFNSLSWTIREEYRNAGYKMLAWVNPAMNARVALRYSVLMFPICVGLCVVGVTDWSFAITSTAINGWMFYEAVRFWKFEGQKGSARGLFWASVWHLPIVLVLAMVQKQGLLQRILDALTGRSSIEDEEDFDYADEEDLEIDTTTQVETKAS
ncbi:mitochondria protoheme IX farnesyltransferase [Pseudovirgaria hyperparasitica]|uniref:Protoheme IX farnesyltransferase, mitochondrial n=1 Tax=Pseudovirgaria hyperparasitica TaxID=470096 RepID=A0A6A6W1Y4_9PEZI|nr:mitochondria protoheme IX farnesyltransferase [Pseudovirgaria hyperparasitica]KAF2755051.1 mitochondria protoheme IX farnesyltransferase [Pseudovirgaria hyperparasitica]